ncbi:MAG: phosphotransferase [Thermomonas sp.]
MIGRDEIMTLVPHQGAMCLWDEVVAWDQQDIVLRAGNHRDPAHPLRNRQGQLRALHLCEYGAQAMAVHGGLRARANGERAKPGFLVALRGVELQLDRIDTLPGLLQCTATLLVDGEGGWQYQFRVEHDGVLLAQGRAAVIPQPRDAMQASATGHAA